MNHLNIPQGHQAVMPYLMLEGAAQFIDFCTNVFQAEVTSRHMRDEHLVMHAELNIAGSTIMIADTTDDWKKQTANLFVYVKDADESYSLALAHGAVSLMGLSDQEYGRTCGVTDPSGKCMVDYFRETEIAYRPAIRQAIYYVNQDKTNE